MAAAPQTTPKSPAKTEPPASLADTLARLRTLQRREGSPSYEERVRRLDRLEAALLRRKEDVARAVSRDFGNRSRHETLVAEVFVTLNTIKYTREHLAEWMEVEPRHVSWLFAPGRAEIRHQPLGVVGIISPWNYPLQLGLAPLAIALAAGNRVMLKPSELTPETSAITADIVHEALGDDIATTHTGGADVGEAFSRLPFDHLLFTGSTRVGQAVMRAAAENLVPVTLELGGKSPVIVGDDYSIEAAAIAIMSGKCFNAGQTCIAPDYVLLPKGKLDAFVSHCKAAVEKLYPTLLANPDYTSIINVRHWKRLSAHLDDAKAKGATLVELNPAKETFAEETHKLPPTLVLEPSEELTVMQEEIFGPILPVKTYETLGEAIDYVNDHPRPLALYYFGHRGADVERVLEHTMSGGVCINDTMLHFAQDDLPFGGVGPSGMGHYHAREGFETFSKKKPVFYQARVNGAALLRPPYGKALDFVLRMLIGK
jgi:coniferyl-aldehyde dehydrogenase